jgi:hypothetical protein
MGAALAADEDGPRFIRPRTAGQAVMTEADEPRPAADEAALTRYAAAYRRLPDLPRLALILVDDGSLPDAVASVRALPWPVTVAIDPGRADAAEAMAAYRAAGIEVMAVLNLPAGAEPSDVAVTYSAVFDLLPETIGVVDTGEGGLQAARPVRDQALAQIAAGGRGAVLAAGGLNSPDRAAAAAGVPLAVAERSLDAAAGEAAMARQLAQAAFAARRAGGAVLVGQVDAATLVGLTLWSESREAEQVAVAPVSTILLRE